MSNDQNPSAAVAIRLAAAPFDDDEAEVVLCTSDDVHFRVDKLFLSRASPFFKDMFKLPQPSLDSDPTPRDEQGRPIIHVPEDSQILRKLLGYCYPGTMIAMDYITDIPAIVPVLVKYDMNTALQKVRKQLLSPQLLRRDPLAVFAIAYRFGFREEAIMAMKQSIRHPLIMPYVSELDYIPIAAYHTYLNYRKSCAERIANLTDLSQPNNIWDRFSWISYAACACPKDGRYNLRVWFLDYVQQVCKALAVRPCVEFAADPEWFKSPIKIASSCSTCGLRVTEDLYGFASLILIPRVRQATSQVSDAISSSSPECANLRRLRCP